VCSITNTRNSGAIELQKVWSGTPGQTTLRIGSTAGGFDVASQLTGANGASPLTTGQKGVDTGTYYLSENGGLTNYTAGSFTCFNDNGAGTNANNGVKDGDESSVTVGANNSVPVGTGDDVVCSITNTRNTGSIQVTKFNDLNANGTQDANDPAIDTWAFWIDLNHNGVKDANEPTANTTNGVATFSGVDTGTGYWVCETQQTGWFSSNPGSASESMLAPCKAVNVTTGTTTSTSFGNYQKTKVKVVKTVDGIAPTPADGNIPFDIRYGAQPIDGGSTGTIIATATANSTNGGVIGPDDWTTVGSPAKYPLEPGTYQLCETVPFGYSTSAKNGDADGDGTPGEYGDDWFYPGQGPNTILANEIICVPFTVISGSDTVSNDGLSNTVVFTIDNGRPALQRTIGYWKNWASCASSSTKKAPILDRTMAKGEPTGIAIGALTLHGSTSNPNVAPDCALAVSILNKSTYPQGKKVASDPAYNVAAQLLAFRLNLLIPSAANCSLANLAADKAQYYLQQIGFNDSTNPAYNWKTTKGKQLAANLNYLEGILNHYNNATLTSQQCASALQLPYPNVVVP
jgi:hypothetical protein